jgi:TP901 family phage tail tape measure protein
MELAGKWESLDTNTQRYIATIAAGSRQQSRFIAMMSDYGRTQELVGEAQNSAGASNKQYEKSLDSVESKLNQLKNAWTEFTTGIMNSDLVKFFVDLLTNFVNGINQVTQGFDGFTSSISKIGMVIGIFNLLTALVKKLGKEFGLSLSMGAKEGANSLRAEVFKAVDDSKAKSKELGQTASDAPRKLGQEF